MKKRTEAPSTHHLRRDPKPTLRGRVREGSIAGAKRFTSCGEAKSSVFGALAPTVELTRDGNNGERSIGLRHWRRMFTAPYYTCHWLGKAEAGNYFI